MGDLKMSDELVKNRKYYKNEIYDNQLEFIRSMGKCPTTKMLGFLQKVIDFSDSADIQIEAMKAIHLMNEGTTTLNKMMNSSYKNYNIVIKHVLDNKIN